MKTLLLAFCGVLFTSLSFASSTEQFIQGLAADLLFTKTDRAIELGHRITVSEFGILGRIFSPDAIATYNANLNTISITGEDLETVQGYRRIKDARAIRGVKYATSNLSTIFHEMGHGEMDVFIENKIEIDDIALMYFYDNTLKPFYKQNFPGFNPHTLFQENFGYYRSELIDFMYEEINNVLLNNGYNKFKNSCFLTKNQKKQLKDGIRLEDFTKFQTVASQGLELYRLKIGPKYIFVRGKDIDLSKVNNPKMMEQLYLRFWSYHQTFYGFPMNQNDLVKRLNNNTPLRKGLIKCRTKLWTDYQNG